MGKGIIAIKGSGGGGKLYAAIDVEFPVGSVCTCSKGSKTLRASKTDGNWIFAVPEAGEWTVSITNGSKSKSKIVNITEQYQLEEVKLTYELVLFDSGSKVEWGSIVQYSGYDNVSISNKITCGRVSNVSLRNTGALAYTTANISLEGYSKLKVRFTSLSGISAHIGVADMSNPSSKVTYSTWAASQACSVANFGSGGVAELDISSLSNSLSVVLGFSSVTNETGSNCEVDKVWLE